MEILLVEDNQGDIFLFNMFFSHLGIGAKLTVLKDGASALEYLSESRLKKAEEVPGLIVLDVNLPDQSGFEILSQIRNNQHLFNETKIIMFTSSSEDGDKLYAKQLGAYDFFTKPIDISEYEEAVRLICYMGYNTHKAVV
jgi:DNA-binding response OmpR family regulator